MISCWGYIAYRIATVNIIIIAINAAVVGFKFKIYFNFISPVTLAPILIISISEADIISHLLFIERPFY